VTHNAADAKLADAAYKAKSVMIGEIIQFNNISEAVASAKSAGFEDEENSTHLFSVTNPTKFGSVVKYTVTG
jgi:hypothetical protein